MWQVRERNAVGAGTLRYGATADRLDARKVGALARRAVADMGAGIAYGSKAVLQPRDEELMELTDRTMGELCPAAERLNWKLNALVSANARYCAVKIVGSNACNRAFGQPRSQSLIVLYDKLTMRPLALFDGTEVSARRTGAYASMVVEAALGDSSELTVALYGAGPIADCVIDDLHAHHPFRIGRIDVRSRRHESAVQFAAAAARRTGLDVRAVAAASEDRADLVITATNAGTPVVAPQMLDERVVVLHLGGDELPARFIERVLEQGSVVCDDVATVCHRNSQSLPLYFSRQGRRLEELASQYGIRNLHELTGRPAVSLRRPALFTCVGLPVLDLYLAQWLHEQPSTGAGPAGTRLALPWRD